MGVKMFRSITTATFISVSLLFTFFEKGSAKPKPIKAAQLSQPFHGTWTDFNQQPMHWPNQGQQPFHGPTHWPHHGQQPIHGPFHPNTHGSDYQDNGGNGGITNIHAGRHNMMFGGYSYTNQDHLDCPAHQQVCRASDSNWKTCRTQHCNLDWASIYSQIQGILDDNKRIHDDNMRRHRQDMAKLNQDMMNMQTNMQNQFHGPFWQRNMQNGPFSGPFWQG